MNIRPAIVQDAPEIARVHIRSWQHTYRGKISPKLLDNLSYEEKLKKWTQFISEGVNVWVIENQAHKCVGFVSMCPSRDKEDNSLIIAEISAIYLLPKFQRKGLGRELCQTVFKHAHHIKFKKIIVWVLETNHQACSFYEMLGFSKTSDRKIGCLGGEQLPLIKFTKKL